METCGCCQKFVTEFKRFSLKSLDPDAPSLVWFVCAGCEREINEDTEVLSVPDGLMSPPRSQSIH